MLVVEGRWWEGAGDVGTLSAQVCCETALKVKAYLKMQKQNTLSPPENLVKTKRMASVLKPKRRCSAKTMEMQVRRASGTLHPRLQNLAAPVKKMEKWLGVYPRHNCERPHTF